MTNFSITKRNKIIISQTKLVKDIGVIFIREGNHLQCYLISNPYTINNELNPNYKFMMIIDDSHIFASYTDNDMDSLEDITFICNGNCDIYIKATDEEFKIGHFYNKNYDKYLGNNDIITYTYNIKKENNIKLKEEESNNNKYFNIYTFNTLNEFISLLNILKEKYNISDKITLSSDNTDNANAIIVYGKEVEYSSCYSIKVTHLDLDKIIGDK